MNFLSSTRNPLSATLFAIGERENVKIVEIVFSLLNRVRTWAPCVCGCGVSKFQLDTYWDDKRWQPAVDDCWASPFFRTKIAIFVLKLSSSAQEPFLMWVSTRECGEKRARIAKFPIREFFWFLHYPPLSSTTPSISGTATRTKWEFSIEQKKILKLN